jgi:hypothetical protein
MLAGGRSLKSIKGVLHRLHRPRIFRDRLLPPADRELCVCLINAFTTFSFRHRIHRCVLHMGADPVRSAMDLTKQTSKLPHTHDSSVHTLTPKNLALSAGDDSLPYPLQSPCIQQSHEKPAIWPLGLPPSRNQVPVRISVTRPTPAFQPLCTCEGGELQRGWMMCINTARFDRPYPLHPSYHVWDFKTLVHTFM